MPAAAPDSPGAAPKPALVQLQLWRERSAAARAPASTRPGCRPRRASLAQFIEQEIGQYLNFLPPELRKAIEQFGVEAALNITRDVTKAYTPQRYFDIVAGMANATGINNDHLMNLVLFPELIKAGCSMIGAWGKATAGGAGGLIQLRALDWTTNGPFQKFPVLINWHPTQQPGAPFAGFNHTVLSWAGLVGAITGWSASGISISEKVWLQYSGVENIVGEPFTFVLQDMLWGEANPNQPTTAPYWDIDACLAKVASTNRTCSIWMGIGDTKSSSFRMVSYGFEQVNIYNDVNFPFYPPWHQQFDDLVFVNKHVQPSHDSCMNDLIAQAYGAMTAADVLHITSSDHSGDMHAAIMDHGTGYMYVSNASPYVNGTVTPAYARQFIRVDMQWAWTS